MEIKKDIRYYERSTDSSKAWDRFLGRMAGIKSRISDGDRGESADRLMHRIKDIEGEIALLRQAYLTDKVLDVAEKHAGEVL